MKRLIIGLLLFGCSLVADDGRQGTDLSIGIGFGNMSTQLDNENSIKELAGLWTVKLGYGFTSNIVGFIEGSSQTLNTTVSKVDYTINQNSIGIGMAYYLYGGSASPYLSAYVGEANENIAHTVSSTEVSEYSSGSFGDLRKFGVGYEYKQWFFQADYINSKNKRVESNGVVGNIGYNFHIFR